MIRSSSLPTWTTPLLLVACATDLFAQRPPYDVFPPSDPPYYRVRYEAGARQGEIVYPVNYTIWMTSYFGASYTSPYATSKGGIVQLSKSLALAWATDNIQVNALLPGWFETELTDGARVQVPGLYERVLARIPAGRWAKPEDIAGTAIWLASPASGYVTGAAIPVDGGFSSSLF